MVTVCKLLGYGSFKTLTVQVRVWFSNTYRTFTIGMYMYIAVHQTSVLVCFEGDTHVHACNSSDFKDASTIGKYMKCLQSLVSEELSYEFR